MLLDTLRQKRVTICGKTFWADPELIPLLKALNMVGLKTRSHCYGHQKGNSAWVAIRMKNITGIEIKKRGEYNEVLLKWKK